MLKKDVMEFFETRDATAKAFRVTPSFISMWPDQVPVKWAALADVLSRGRLKFDPADYDLEYFD